MKMPAPYYQDELTRLYLGDCRDILPLLEPGSVDLVLTDPPYGIALDTSNEKYHHGISRNRIVGDADIYDPVPIIELGLPSIIWGGNVFANSLPPSVGWLCWNKTVRDNAHIHQGDMELAWTNFIRRPRALQHLWIGAYKDSESGQRAQHPTQKPVALMEWCISIATEYIAVNSVLDPYCGSGTTLVAARLMGRRSIGIEIDERYAAATVERLRQTVMNLYPMPAAPDGEQGALL